ncbi:hypothetical protein ACN2A0_04160 [Aerococcus viridans]
MDVSEELLKQLIAHLKKQIVQEDSLTLIYDQLDHKHIGAHYAQTHLSIALLIDGFLSNDKEQIKISEKMINSYLLNYDVESKKK